MPRPRSGRRLPAHLLLASALAVPLLVSSCSNDTSEGPTATIDHTPTSTTTTSAVRGTTSSTTDHSSTTTTTTEPQSPEAKVKAAFLKAHAVYFEITGRPDPEDPALSRSFVGTSLGRAQENLRGYVEKDAHAEFPGDGRAPVPAVEKVRLETPAQALVTFCLVDDTRQVTSGGTVLNDAVASRHSRASMAYGDGLWRISSQQLLGEWPDGKGCGR
ncbi:hypothetical protein KSP35_14525 [Aquihabitans sp. G128]|uniref:hypothetical protein n=1 Tax=Aquihabitans sp. G128 TaxID=2849779 RepID=UPI001C232FA2|nr:hypothetical protein [Aquihabitans sp. G128]QXC59597.1 hypothetical protein KSP35_14525 [Aquihabitans sp. G128]